MEIISRGHGNRRICNNCGCEFKYTSIDVHYTIIPSLYNTRHEEYVRCPQCYDRIVLKVVR